jgi:hypothetical protein
LKESETPGRPPWPEIEEVGARAALGAAPACAFTRATTSRARCAHATGRVSRRR